MHPGALRLSCGCCQHPKQACSPRQDQALGITSWDRPGDAEGSTGPSLAAAPALLPAGAMVGGHCWLAAVPPDPCQPQHASMGLHQAPATMAAWCSSISPSPCSRPSVPAGNTGAPNVAVMVPIASCPTAVPGVDSHPCTHLRAAVVPVPAPSKGAFDRKQTLFFFFFFPVQFFQLVYRFHGAGGAVSA